MTETPIGRFIEDLSNNQALVNRLKEPSKEMLFRRAKGVGQAIEEKEEDEIVHVRVLEVEASWLIEGGHLNP